jgi:hypothetical protein
MSTSVAKISSAVAAVQADLVALKQAELAAGVTASQEAYQAASDAHSTSSALVAELVASSSANYTTGYNATESAMQTIINELADDSADLTDFDSLKELVDAVVSTSSMSETSSISLMKDIDIDFDSTQSAEEASLKAEIGTQSQAQDIFDGAYSAPWDSMSIGALSNS